MCKYMHMIMHFIAFNSGASFTARGLCTNTADGFNSAHEMCTVVAADNRLHTVIAAEIAAYSSLHHLTYGITKINHVFAVQFVRLEFIIACKLFSMGEPLAPSDPAVTPKRARICSLYKLDESLECGIFDCIACRVTGRGRGSG